MICLEDKTTQEASEEPLKIQFIDKDLKEGEETHYRCVKCKQYILSDLIHTHKCKVSYPSSINMRIIQYPPSINLKTIEYPSMKERLKI